MTAAAWSLQVEGFGPIAKAHIKLAPLVIICGKNNTGKSYLSSLIWGVANSLRTVVSDVPEEHPALSACIDWVQRAPKDSSIVEIKEVDLSFFKELARSIIVDNRNRIAADAISLESATVAKLDIDFCDIEEPRRFRFSTIDIEGRNGAFRPSPRFGDIERYYRIKGVNVFTARGWENPKTYRYIVLMILRRLLLQDSTSFSYIPAARTGLMHAYSHVVRNLLGGLRLGTTPQEEGALSAPTISFLQDISTDFRSRIAMNDEIANILEHQVIRGQVSSVRAPGSGFIYSPNGADVELPLHATSSLVTEMAPLILMLRSGRIRKSVIFEEPEAHLHLEAQRALVRVIARMINKGIQVIITTHSDTFLQEINNLMHLHDHIRKDNIMKKYNIDKMETIDPDFANGYILQQEAAGTVSLEMEKSNRGFVNPEMNDVISNSVELSWDLEQ